VETIAKKQEAPAVELFEHEFSQKNFSGDQFAVKTSTASRRNILLPAENH